MRFRFDPEHDELRRVIRRLLTESAGPAAVISRESEPEASDPRLPARLAEIGVYGLGVPERFGGAGSGLLELGVVFQEAGRAALGAPLLSPVLAADLLLQVAGSAAAGGPGRRYSRPDRRRRADRRAGHRGGATRLGRGARNHGHRRRITRGLDARRH